LDIPCPPFIIRSAIRLRPLAGFVTRGFGLIVRQRQIIHLDMDAFYPSVEVLDQPDLKGKAVIVGGGKKRGVVSSASYEARKYGVHSAQPMAEAIRLCPRGVFLPVRMWRYKEVSRKIFEIYARFTPLLEPLSIDEAFLDVTDSILLFGSAAEMAARIKEAVRKEIGLTVSAGVAPSKFVAKIASDMEKPDGLTVVEPLGVRAFLSPLPVSKMWGVGKVTQAALKDLGVHTFGDLSRFPMEVLERRFGAHGRHMHLLSMGIDDREVVPEHSVKSVGHEETFLEDLDALTDIQREVLSLAEKVARRLRKLTLSCKTVTLKLKYRDFTQITRSETLGQFTDDGMAIYGAARGLIEKTEAGKRPVRLLGVSVSQLKAGGVDQLSLFGPRRQEKRRMLNEALDCLQDKHGEGSVRPGTLVGR
jgi:DNA polymerase-4